MLKNNRRNNFIKKLRLLGIATMLSTTLVFSGCSEILTLLEDSSEFPYFNTMDNNTESESISEPVSEIIPPEDNSEEPPSEFDGWTNPKIPDFSDGTSPEISNDRAFNAFLEYNMKNRRQTFSFYANDGFTIDNDLLLYRFSLPYVSTNCTPQDDGRDYWEIYIEYYPGTLIADAYETGDYNNLTIDELEVLQIAVDFIENTVNPQDNVLVKERLIHDFICFSTIYSNPKSNDPVPRHCTAVGLLLDGEANCQGYADCFEMLCRMAGLKTDKQSGSAEGNLHVWNIINLDGSWYSVDVTYDDTTYNTSGYYYPAYIYFNAGKDILEETHYVPRSNELIYIVDYSDDNYLYYTDIYADVGYMHTPYSEDVPAAEQEIAKLLEDSVKNDSTYVSYFIEGQYLEAKDIVNEIQSYIIGAPNPITISTYHVGNNTFICGEPK